MAALLKKADLYKDLEKLYVGAMENEALSAANRFEATLRIFKIDKYYKPFTSLEDAYQLMHVLEVPSQEDALLFMASKVLAKATEQDPLVPLAWHDYVNGFKGALAR